MTDLTMTADQSAGVVLGLREAGVRIWVMGGWGVDALLGCETRSHHDLDLLVLADDLPGLMGWLRRDGFARTREWKENRRIRVADAVYDTAFVENHADGREIDVHAVHLDSHADARLATADPWILPPDFLAGSGTIGGHRVDCVTRETQFAMHHGYELPAHHREDLRLLRAGMRL